jgi:hypothetical protein
MRRMYTTHVYEATDDRRIVALAREKLKASGQLFGDEAR